MFFDEENCRSIRILTEISGFLEASIEKLLVLEKETLLEIEKSKREEQSQIKVKEEPVEEVELPEIANTNNTILNAADTSIQNSADTSMQNAADKSMQSAMSEYQYRGDINFSSNSSSLSKTNIVKRKLDIHSSTEVCQDKIRKLANSAPGSITIKKEYINFNLDEGVGASFSPETSSELTEHFSNSFSKRKSPNNLNSSLRVKKELGTCCVCRSSDVKSSLIENSMVAPLSIELDSSDLYNPAYIIREHEFFKARIRFKKCFSYDQVYDLLTTAGVEGIDDIAIVQKNAIVAFLCERKLKALLDMNNQSALKKLKAVCVEPYKKFHVIEEKDQPLKKKNKKKWRYYNVSN